MKYSIALLLLTILSSCKSKQEQTTQNNNTQPNVLFIAVDDLRPTLGCYGDHKVISPNIDALAKESLVFKKHYVQVSTCGASRCSMLTSTYPAKAIEIKNSAFKKIPQGTTTHPRTLPELFRKNGYHTMNIGKISHSSFGVHEGGQNIPEMPEAWDEMLTPTELTGVYANNQVRKKFGGYRPIEEFIVTDDNELRDGLLADTAIKKLKEFKDNDKPFFMGLGFWKPHLPFVAPKKYRDLYNEVDIPSLNEMERGDTKRVGKCREFYEYYDFPFEKPKPHGKLTEEQAKHIRRAYYACVTYTDHLIGKVMKTLKDLELDKNTIVVLWGDHGWHLGENNAWAKHTPLEKSMHSPLIIKSPYTKKGKTSTSIAASLDIFPTLVELCHLKNKETHYSIAGKSLVPILKNPETQVRKSAVSFWAGSTTVTDGTYRLVIYKKRKYPKKIYYELYNHISDPGELTNIASKEPETVGKMMQLLKNEYPNVLAQ